MESKKYKIEYLSTVVRKDIPKLSHTGHEKIKKAVEDKLVYNPEFFGKPLRYTLKHLRSLRVGEYRVIYLIEKDAVLIVSVQNRSVAYKEAIKRLS